MLLVNTSRRNIRPMKELFATYLVLVLAIFALAQPAMAEERIKLDFALPTSEILTYQITSRHFLVDKPGAVTDTPPILEWSMRLNVEIEPLDAAEEHPFVYWFDSVHLTILGMPFDHLVGSERWTGKFAPSGELLSLQRPPIFDEIGIDMDLLLVDLFLQPPSTPLAIGDAWEVDYQLMAGGAAEIATKIAGQYTLLSYDLEAHTVDLAEMTFAEYKAEIEVNPGIIAEVTGEMTAEISSTIDLQTGQRLLLNGTAFETSHMSIPGSNVVETIYFVSEITLERIWPAE